MADYAARTACRLAGHIQRPDERRIAPYFTTGQRIRVPGCGELLFVEKLAALMARVKWVSAGEWQQTGTALGR